MNADFACTWGADAPPGGYSTSTATSDLPGRLGIACSKFGFTMSPGPCAAASVLVKIATAAHNAAKAGRLIMIARLHGTLVSTAVSATILYHRWYDKQHHDFYFSCVPRICIQPCRSRSEERRDGNACAR